MLVFAIAVTAALLAERVVFACIVLVFYLFGHGPDRKSIWFVSSLFQNVTAVVGSLASSGFRVFTLSAKTIVWCALMLVIWGVLYTIACYSSEALIQFQEAYNRKVGGTYRLVFVIPMQIIHGIWTGLVPLYNLAVYIWKTAPLTVLLENVLRNWPDFKSCVANLMAFCGNLTLALYKYIGILLAPPDSFDPNLRLLDLLTQLAYWWLFVSYLLAWLSEICAVASSVLDIAMYPFMDIHFGLGMHNAINSVLTLFLQVPAMTVQRCTAGSDVVYCLPDFQPAIDLAVLGIRHFGKLADNWLDITSIIIQSVLTNTSPTCVGVSHVIFASGQGIFGGNETITVGVDAHTIAKTDGWNVEAYSRGSTRHSAFPFMVNIELGIAVVSVATGIQGLLGCACTDQAYGLQLVCAVAPLDPYTAAYYVPVEFDVPNTSFYMGCGKSSIHLDSIRWPVTRFTSPNSNAHTTPPVAEAALYIRPACSSEHIDVVCVETFKLAQCFPYCMALWTRGYTGSLILRGGEEWSNTVAMTARDCGLHTWDLQSGEMASVTNTLQQNSGVTSPWVAAEVQLNSTHCVYAPNIFSRMLRNSTPAYAEYRSVLMAGQPFAFAGDLILTAVNTVGDTWGVDVQRIWGNQANEFTVVHVNKFIPALPVCLMPSDCTMAANSCAQGQCRVAVPYAFDSTPWAKVPAIATDRYVYCIYLCAISVCLYISVCDVYIYLLYRRSTQVEIDIAKHTDIYCIYLCAISVCLYIYQCAMYTSICYTVEAHRQRAR